MRCEKFFAETTARDSEGRYIVRLPFSTEEPDLKVVNTKRIAEKRLKLLVSKLGKADEMKAKYTEDLEEYLQLGHMEMIKTTQVRIVFDASCKSDNGVSLNDLLMVGPTLQPELRHLLIRWRQHRICLSADFVKMYRQVKVASEDVDFQRILWKEDELSTKTEEFKIVRVTFESASAPYLAVKLLQQMAHDEGASFPVVAEKVINDFYIDDLLTGCENMETAMQLYKEINSLLQKGGFKLQKWSINCGELLDKIRENAEGLGKEEGLKLKMNEVMKLLRLTWNRRTDAFQYTVTLLQLMAPVTKRTIISDISRSFDPLGWVAPSVMIVIIIIINNK